jgi:hypothetical protein
MPDSDDDDDVGFNAVDDAKGRGWHAGLPQFIDRRDRTGKRKSCTRRADSRIRRMVCRAAAGLSAAM